MDESAATRHDPVVITGCGWVTPHAAGRIAHVLAAAEAASRDRSASGFLPVPDALLAAACPGPTEVAHNKGAHLTAAGVRLALEEAGITHHQKEASSAAAPTDVPPERIGLVLGCALAGQLGMMRFATEVREQSARFVSPINFPQTVGNHIAGAMARAFNLRGVNLTLAGPAAGLAAIHEAVALLAANQADLVLAGGTDELTAEVASALGSSGAPWSEGACWFALERESRAAARAAGTLARIVSSRAGRLGRDAAATGATGALWSVCEVGPRGAVFVPAWIGHNLAAAGPSALAAAIGAVHGCHVPLIDSADPRRIASGTPAGGPAPGGDDMTRVVAFAGAGGAADARVEVDVPPPRGRPD
jgi:3-oxoacyl-(acyl-carrier-protein) synthase